MASSDSAAAPTHAPDSSELASTKVDNAESAPVIPVTNGIPIRQDQSETPAPDSTNAESSTAENTCGVCKSNPPKYKCPRCYMP
jgi:hypothetical protein